MTKAAAATPKPETPPATPPESPPVVRKASLARSPREIALEKTVSRLEDEVEGLKGWQGEVNQLMAGMGLGREKKPASEAAPEPKGGFLDDLARELGFDG